MWNLRTSPGALTPRRNKLFLLFVLPLVAPLLPGCTHIEYSRGWQNLKGTYYDEYTDQTSRYDADLSMQELALLDGTGGVCSAIATSSARSSARMDAEKRMREQGGLSAQYEYKVYSPAEFEGLNCGIYYKWGQGLVDTSVANGDLYGDPSTIATGSGMMKRSEGGLHLGGTERFTDKIPWLRKSIDVRLGMGRFMPLEEGGTPILSAEWTFHTPFTYGVLAFPEELYGFGAHAYAGADFLGWLFTRGQGKWYQKFEYGARLGYVLPLKYLSLSAWGGWHRGNYAQEDYWARFGEWRITGMLRVNLAAFKGGGRKSKSSEKASMRFDPSAPFDGI